MDKAVSNLEAAAPAEEFEANLIKSGEIPIGTTLSRSVKYGLRLRVRTLPVVEEFIRSVLTSGEVRSVLPELGRYWSPVSNGDRLEVYETPAPLGVTYTDTGLPFTLDKPGWPLLEAVNNPNGDGRLLTAAQAVQMAQQPNLGGSREILNLSFIRLVGTSDAGGVLFGVKGVYTMDQVLRIRDRIADAERAFYVMYLKPVNLDVQVSVQEYPGR